MTTSITLTRTGFCGAAIARLPGLLHIGPPIGIPSLQVKQSLNETPLRQEVTIAKPDALKEILRMGMRMKGIANKTIRRVTFSFISPDAKEVYIAGTFNNWDPRKNPFKKHSKGWKAVKYLAPGMYEYRLVVDGIWVDDPTCTNRQPNQYGSENCVLEV